MKISLVLEGGATRGVYTAGVLDAFLENNIDIKNVYGVSAGALNAISYLSKQKGRSLRINKEHFNSGNCIDFKRVIQGVVNIDYLLKDVNETIDPLDWDEFNKRESFVVVATNILTGSAVYKKIEDFHRDLPYIKASASMPIFSSVVEVDGYKLLDGGVSDSIPVMKALDDGADKVIVVLTRDKGFVCKPYRFTKAYKAKYARYPKFIKTFENRYNKYNVTRDLLEQFEDEGKVLTIFPSKPLIIKHLEKNLQTIDDTYQLGYDDAIAMMSKIKAFIGGDNYGKDKKN